MAIALLSPRTNSATAEVQADEPPSEAAPVGVVGLSSPQGAGFRESLSSLFTKGLPQSSIKYPGGCRLVPTHNVAIYRSEMNHLPSSDTVARLSVKILEQLRQMGIRELGPFCDLTLLLLGLSLGFYAIDLGSCSSFGSICHGLETVFL